MPAAVTAAPLAAAAATRVLGPQGVWLAWAAPATVVVPAILVLGAYARGDARLARSGRRPSRPRRAVFAAAVVSALLGTLSPLDAMAAQLLTAHMVQHLLVIVVVPVLLALARPSPVLLAGAAAALGDGGRRRVRQLQRSRPLRSWRRLRRRGQGAPAAAALTWTVHLTTVAAWHVPAAYDAALRLPVVHGLQHATLLLTAAGAWHVSLQARAGRTSGVALLGVVGGAVSGGLLAALLTFSARPWYAAYRATAPAWGLTALQDQQLAGAVMWVGGGVLYLAMGALLFARWLGAESRAPARAARTRLRAGVGCWWALAVLGLFAGACGVDERQLDPEQAEAVRAGRAALVSYGCVGCHTIPGTVTTQGRVGPPLAGIASRKVLAGRLPNTPANLVRWIREPQRVDPGNAMPDLGVTEADAAAMAAYLGTLERGTSR